MEKVKVFLCLCLVFLFSFVYFSCVFYSQKVSQVDKTLKSVVINSPTKIHLFDGSMILFPEGFEVTGDVIKGKGIEGIRYDLTRKFSTLVVTISLDSVAFMEYYEKKSQSGPLLGCLAAPVLFIAAIQNEDISKAFFGSCPTVYSFDGEEYYLQAECFSYSISPHLETDDLDRIDRGKVVDGRFILNVRNEALETHYINQMKLLIVDHPDSYEAFPKNKPFLAPKDKIIYFGRESNIIEASNKSGRDVKEILSARDEQWYQSDSSIVHELTEKVTKDWIEVMINVPEGAKDMVVALRFRNTLFHTVEFYDLVLKKYSARALDWVGIKMSDPVYLNQLYNWYKSYFGIQVELWNGETFEQKEFINDTGPIAWRQVAFELQAPQNKIAKLRFRFLPDNVMLDWVGISFDSSHEFAVREVECSEITDVRGNRDNILPSLLERSDERYLITYPAESYYMTFNVGDEPEGMNRTYFLNSRGFYIEWIRQDWLSSSGSAEEDFAFQLNEQSILNAAKLWIAKKSEFEKQFFSSRIQLEGGKIK